MIHHYLSDATDSPSWSVSRTGMPGIKSVLLQAFDGCRTMSRNAVDVDRARLMAGVLRVGGGALRTDSGGEDPAIVFEKSGTLVHLTVRDYFDGGLAGVDLDARHVDAIASAMEDAADRAEASAA
jgi:hypothetical protein